MSLFVTTAANVERLSFSDRSPTFCLELLIRLTANCESTYRKNDLYSFRSMSDENEHAPKSMKL